MTKQGGSAYWNWINARGGREFPGNNPDILAAPESLQAEGETPLLDWINNYGPERHLSETQRQVFQLAFLEEKSERDTAAQMSLTLWKIQKIKKEIKEIIQQKVYNVTDL